MSDMHDKISEVTKKLGRELPRVYGQFLTAHTGGVRDDGLFIYHASELAERNNTFAVQQFTPEFLAVGDDSGGRLIVIRFDDADAMPFIVDAGALVPNMMPSMRLPLAATWADWAANGFPLGQD